MSEIRRRDGTESAVGAEIAKATGHLLNEYTGRGPAKSRSFVSDELITVVLNDTMTTVEQRLFRDGNADLVLALRSAYQEAMGPALTAAVEELSGQRVIAFLSANHLDPDIAVESFVLAPSTGGPGA